jgi:hypothetical protein
MHEQTTGTMLTQLPFELYILITEHLMSVKDIYSLLLTNRHFSEMYTLALSTPPFSRRFSGGRLLELMEW